MKCTILGRHIRLVGKAIHALAKVGEELYIEPVGDGISFVTVNSSKSAVMTFKFYKDFFESYEEKCVDDCAKIPASDPMASSQNPSKCRLMMRSILMVFKNISVLEKTVESCSLQVLPFDTKVRVTLHSKCSITRVYTFPFLESERLHTEYAAADEADSFTCQAQVLNDAALNFLKNQEEVTMKAMPDKFVMKNFVSSDPRENRSAVHTELTMYPNEFEAFEVQNETSLTYCLKELRSMIAFADAFGLPLTGKFGTSRNPIFFHVNHADVFEGSLVMATMSNDDQSEPETSFNTSQAANSTFRATEELLDRSRRRSRNPNVSINYTAIPTRAEKTHVSMSDVRSNDGDVSMTSDLFNFKDPEPRTSTLDIAAEPPPRFSEGLINHDSVLNETAANAGETPPAKRARYFFQRCFEKTLDPSSIPGAQKVLAPDSDEEN